MHLLRLRFYTLFPLSYRQEYTEHVRSIYVHIRGIFSIYGAYTGHFFPYTGHIRGIFCIYGAYTGHFFAYTEHIRGII